MAQAPDALGITMQLEMIEEFRPIQDFQGYEVSNLGNIKSTARKIKCSWNGKVILRTIKEQMLKPQINKWGYSTIKFGKHGKRKLVHRLVAIEFIENPLNLPEVNHKDGVKTNNHVSNLEWCTGDDNKAHCVAMGLSARGVQKWSCKLNDEKVLRIKQLSKQGVSGVELSRMYNISPSMIYSIRAGRFWKHVKLDESWQG